MADLRRIAVETIIKQYIMDIQDSPKRSIRNLVDLGILTIRGKFKDSFLSATQKMLENEDGKYYDLVADAVNNIDNQTLITFGINVAYNGCTIGAAKIREIEKEENINVPWSVFLRVKQNLFEKNEKRYLEVIRRGEEIGIHTWFIFTDKLTSNELSLAKNNKNCAFVYFLTNEDLNMDLLTEVKRCHNVMLSLKYVEDRNECFKLMRDNKLLYSAYTIYDEDLERNIIFDDVEELHPAFTIFFPKNSQDKALCEKSFEFIKNARNEQTYQTILWEGICDTDRIDMMLSEDSCRAEFDEQGELISGDTNKNLFADDLLEIFKSAFPKQ